jgi:hypothetical protein
MFSYIPSLFRCFPNPRGGGIRLPPPPSAGVPLEHVSDVTLFLRIILCIIHVRVLTFVGISFVPNFIEIYQLICDPLLVVRRVNRGHHDVISGHFGLAVRVVM